LFCIFAEFVDVEGKKMMIYRIARAIVAIFIKLFNKWEIIGSEHVPKSGPTVFVANHISNWDPPALACSVKRTIHFMAKEELFKIPVLGTLLTLFRCYPVKRGSADRNALRTSWKYLENGQALGIFPEGKRSKTGEMQPFEQGAALIAIKGKATIVPVGLKGTSKAFPASLRGNICVIFGEPLYYPELFSVKLHGEDIERVNNEIVENIKKLIDGEKTGEVI